MLYITVGTILHSMLYPTLYILISHEWSPVISCLLFDQRQWDPKRGVGVYWRNKIVRRNGPETLCLETGDPAQLPAQLAGRWGQRNWNTVVYVEEKIFSIGPTRAAKVEQKSLATAGLAQRTNQGKTLFNCTLWVPIISVSTLCSLSGTDCKVVLPGRSPPS